MIVRCTAEHYHHAASQQQQVVTGFSVLRCAIQGEFCCFPMAGKPPTPGGGSPPKIKDKKDEEDQRWPNLHEKIRCYYMQKAEDVQRERLLIEQLEKMFTDQHALIRKVRNLAGWQQFSMLKDFSAVQRNKFTDRPINKRLPRHLRFYAAFGELCFSFRAALQTCILVVLFPIC